MKVRSIVCVAVALLAVGCDDPLSDAQKPRRGVAPNIGGLNLPPDAGDPAVPKAPDEPVDPEPLAPAEDPNVEVVEAGPGVSGKGNYSPGIYTTPLSTYFSVREKIQFLQVDHAMKLFRAMNERDPKSHEEFMEKIIKANSIRLPDLRGPDDKYKYDPETGELMVVRQRL